MTLAERIGDAVTRVLTLLTGGFDIGDRLDDAKEGDTDKEDFIFSVAVVFPAVGAVGDSALLLPGLLLLLADK